MKRALITGVTGQDGSYLAEFLVARDYHVVGCARDIAGAKKSLPEQLKTKIDLVLWDMQDQHFMQEVIADNQPDEIYNFAAYSSGSGMYDEAVAISEVNGLAVTRMLEAIRKTNPDIKFCQASSREIFGEAVESPQSESTLANPRSPYGAAKLYADTMIRIYRQHYGLYACSAILFNHESPRRRVEFVTRKISMTAAKIKLGIENELNLGNLNALRDWGYALDYVRAMWLMLQQQRADDYVVATGVSHSVRDFCELAFSHVGLEYRDYLKESAADYRPVEAMPLVGCSAKANSELGWRPEVDFKEMVHMMVDGDIKNLSQDR